MTRRLRLVPRRAFTLAELLVAIAVIGILGTIAVVAVGAFARDVRVPNGVNTVIAALEEARGRAIRDNRLVAVVFRAVLERNDAGQIVGQDTEAVLAWWTGRSEVFPDGSIATNPIKDVFVTIPDSLPRKLPRGVKVAGPDHTGFSIDGSDYVWCTQPELVGTDPDLGDVTEYPGVMFCVLFDGTGSVVTFNEVSGASSFFIDFNRQADPADGSPITSGSDPQDIYNTSFNFPGGHPAAGRVTVFYYDHENDEPNVQPVTFLAVYDDTLAREYRLGDWSDANQYLNELVGPEGYISQFADRIHLNRYSGVPMR